MKRDQLIQVLMDELLRQSNLRYPDGFYFRMGIDEEPSRVLIDGKPDLGALADAVLKALEDGKENP